MNTSANFRLYNIWKGNAEGPGYVRHRIPGIIVTQKGTVIIYNEARFGSGDNSKMDIFCQRSTDEGAHFGDWIYLAKGNDEHKTMNNPVMMQDRNGRIHFLHCEDYSNRGGRVLHRFSDDDGLTWSDPIDLTRFTGPDIRKSFALGPGHGICTDDGTLLVPVWMTVPEDETYHPWRSEVSTFYSKDCGKTWSLGKIFYTTEEITSPNETSAAVLSDGSIYLSIRCQNPYRAKAISPNGYSDWRDYSPEKNLIDPQCFGSVIRCCVENHPETLLFVNCEHTEERTHVTVKGSLDDGKTWTLHRTVDRERGGYADIAVDSAKGNIYVLYEDRYGVTDHLAVFDYEWLEEGK